MFVKKNANITIEVDRKGAELKSLKLGHKEYMWSAKPEYWGKTSPILFPFVGCCKDDKYIYEEKEYKTTRHGFARELDFDMVEEGPDFLSFLLKSNEDTLKIYPFEFELYINYKLLDDGLSISYQVKNTKNPEMLFSIGAHPAFACDESIDYSDFYLEFSEKEFCKLYKLDGNLINPEGIDYLKDEDRIELSKELFKDDALVFNNLKSKDITLRNKVNDDYVKVSLEGFPWLGIWAPVGAPFVCIEPWCGVADFTNHNNLLEDKIGINKISKDENFEVTMNINIG